MSSGVNWTKFRSPTAGSLDIPPISRPGAFTDLINRLYCLLTERVLTSDTLRQQLDTLQARCQADVDRWVELVHDIEVLKIVHRQN